MKKFPFVLLVTMALLLSAIPASHASTTTVTINSANDSAAVSTVVNSTLNITGSPVVLNALQISNQSITFSASGNSSTEAGIESSIATFETGISVSNITLGFNETSINNANKGLIQILYSTSLSMDLKGMVNGKTINMTWRSFNFRGNLTEKGHNANSIGKLGVYFSTEPNFLNFSAFSKSLSNWTSSYISSLNDTEFSMSSSANYTSSAGLGLFNLSLHIDPQYVIKAPGYDNASGNSINIGNPPAHKSDLYYGIAAGFIIIVIVLYYYTRFRRR